MHPYLRGRTLLRCDSMSIAIKEATCKHTALAHVLPRIGTPGSGMGPAATSKQCGNPHIC